MLRHLLKSSIAYVVLGGFAAGCGGASAIGAKEEALGLLLKRPIQGCKSVGKVRGVGGGLGGAWLQNDSLVKIAHNELLKDATSKGATHVWAGPPTFARNPAGQVEQAVLEGEGYVCHGAITFDAPDPETPSTSKPPVTPVKMASDRARLRSLDNRLWRAWQGSASQPGFGSFEANVDLTRFGPVGACGSIEYPKLGCRGVLLDCKTGSDGSIEVVQSLSVRGKCEDGTKLNLSLQGQKLAATWSLPNGQRIAEGTLAPETTDYPMLTAARRSLPPLPPRAEPVLDDELYEVLPQFLPSVLPAGFVTEDPPATRVGGGNDFRVRRSYRRADGSFVDLALLLLRSKHEGATATLDALSKSASSTGHAHSATPPKTLAGFPALFGPTTASGNQLVSIALTARLQIDVQFKGLSNQVLEDILRGLSPEYLAQVEAGGRSAIDALSRTREFEDAQGEKVQMATGQSAFADRVVAMNRGPQRAGNEGDPNRTLGPPDRNKDAGFYALGCRGNIQLAFDDNVLADGPGPDLHIFEVGGFVETISVRISEDGQSWIDAGQVKGQPASLDITKVAKAGAQYRFVEITDLGNECGNEFPGADIDAVGAINGQLFASQNARPVPPSSVKSPGPRAASEDELRRVAEAVQKSEGVPLNVTVDKQGWKMSEKNGGYTVQTSGVARANVDGKGSIETVFINTRRGAQRAEHQLEIYTERQNGGLGPLAQVVIGYGEPEPSAGTLRVNGNRISFSMSGTPYVYELRGSTLFPVQP